MDVPETGNPWDNAPIHPDQTGIDTSQTQTINNPRPQMLTGGSSPFDKAIDAKANEFDPSDPNHVGFLSAAMRNPVVRAVLWPFEKASEVQNSVSGGLSNIDEATNFTKKPVGWVADQIDKIAPNPALPGLPTTGNLVRSLVTPAQVALMAAPGIAEAAGGKVADLGTNIAQASIKPSAKLLNASGSKFDINNLVGAASEPLDIPGAPGNLASKIGKEKTLDNILQYHDALGDAKDAILNAHPEAQISPSTAVSDATDNLNSAMAGGQFRGPVKDQISNSLSQWEADAKDLEGEGGAIDAPTAIKYRQSLGNAARYDMADQTATPGSRIAASEIYDALNKHIADQIPELRPIDAEFAKTIPLRNALATSLGRDANVAPIGLKDAIFLSAAHGLNPASLLPALGKAAIVKGGLSFPAGIAMRQMGDAMEGAASSPNAYVPAVADADGKTYPSSILNRIINDASQPQNVRDAAKARLLTLTQGQP